LLTQLIKWKKYVCILGVYTTSCGLLKTEREEKDKAQAYQLFRQDISIWKDIPNYTNLCEISVARENVEVP